MNHKEKKIDSTIWLRVAHWLVLGYFASIPIACAETVQEKTSSEDGGYTINSGGPRLSEAELMSIYHQTCLRLGLPTQGTDMPDVPPKFRIPHIGDIHVQRGGERIRDINGPVYMGINEKTGFVHYLTTPVIARGKEPPTPTWTREEAVNKAMELLEKAVGGLPYELDLFQAEFSPLLRKWEVAWRRAENGFVWVNSDCARVSMYEKGGLISLAAHFYSKPCNPDKSKVKVTLEQAVQIAEGYARQMVKKFGHRGEWFDGYGVTCLWPFSPNQKDVLGRPASACGLYIVNPNYILDDKKSLRKKEWGLEEWAPGEGIEAKLVWVVMFKASHWSDLTDRLMGKNAVLEPLPVSVYIDIETAEVLGGCF